MFSEAEFFIYSKNSDSKTVDLNKTLRRRLFLVEKIKDAKTIGIVVGTLSVENFLGAIERVKKLAAYRGKRCYVFSIGKPNPAKLANFPEVRKILSCSSTEKAPLDSLNVQSMKTLFPTLYFNISFYLVKCTVLSCPSLIFSHPNKCFSLVVMTSYY